MLNANIALVVSATLTPLVALDIETASSVLSRKIALALTDGSGANQASNLFSDTRTLAASGTEALDLAGVLLNAFGAAITFTKVRALIVVASATNVNDVLVGGAGANGFIAPFGGAAHQNRVRPGGCLVITAPDVNGLAVTATTADLLQMTNSAAGTAVTYDIIIIGS